MGRWIYPTSTPETEILVGDYVYVGKGTVHWEVAGLRENASKVLLRSGMTGRYTLVTPDRLTLFTRRTP